MTDDFCLTGDCPVIEERTDVVRLSEGSGGKEMNDLISEMLDYLPDTIWEGTDDDGAYVNVEGKLVFTSDSYVVTPTFFPGGNIGKLAFCGTVNDLVVMGATPIGLSLNLVIEEGLPKQELFNIVKTIGDLSFTTGIPIVTGDTKVMEKGSVDKIIITTSGVGVTKDILNKKIEAGDVVIVSGGLGEHGAALLSKRYELETDVITDSKPLHEEINEIKYYIKQAKDITRGGLAAVVNELSKKNKVNITLEDEKIPLLSSVRSMTDILGIDPLQLACEGRMIIICSKEQENVVIEILQQYNKLATTIGVISEGDGVYLQTMFGKRILPVPKGNIVPRIC